MRLFSQQTLEGLISEVRDVCQLFSSGLNLKCAVGEGKDAVFHQVAVGNFHQEEGAYHRRAWSGLQDLRAGERIFTVAQLAPPTKPSHWPVFTIIVAK